MYSYREFGKKTHRLIPSRYPPINFFDWVESREEIEQLAELEGYSNDRLSTEYGRIALVAREDWIGGPGATPLMAAFTHFGPSRFSDGRVFGIYYTAEDVRTAIAETKFHREIFLRASKEPPCCLHMREYTSYIQKPLIDITTDKYQQYCQPDLQTYPATQALGACLQQKREWGIIYPSARKKNSLCMAIFRAPALTIPVQAGHYEYVWDGESIGEVKKLVRLKL